MPRYRTTESRAKLRGTFRPGRAKRSPKVERVAAVPPPPEGMSEAASREWNRLAPLICATRTLTAADGPALELLSNTLATAAEAQGVVEREGLTVTGASGIRPHPCVKIFEQARVQATRLLCEFGLTPRARGHVEPVGEPAKGNPFAEIG